MLSKAVKARRRYNRQRHSSSKLPGRRRIIEACDWIHRSWSMGQPMGPFRDVVEREEMIQHQSRFLKGFRGRLKLYVRRHRFPWHRRYALINNGMSPYELILEFKRFLTQDLNARIGQAYVL